MVDNSSLAIWLLFTSSLNRSSIAAVSNICKESDDLILLSIYSPGAEETLLSCKKASQELPAHSAEDTNGVRSKLIEQG